MTFRRNRSRLSLAFGLLLAVAFAGFWGGPLALPASAANPAQAVSGHGLGFIPTTGVATGLTPAAQSRVAQTNSVPASVDLSQWAPPVGNQGSVGSCASWATGYGYRYWLRNHALGSSPTFAPMYLYAQISPGQQNRGSTFPENFNVMVNQGIDPQSAYTQGNYDYTTQPTAAEVTAAAPYKITGYSMLFSGHSTANQTAIEATMAAGQPIVIAIPVYTSFEYPTNLPIIDVPGSTETYYGGHALFAAKYDAQGVWIENSWGTGWGQSGWAELSWAFVNQYAIEAWTATASETASTWSIGLTTSANSVSIGGSATLTATANKTVTSTAYGIDIRDGDGTLVKRCTSGTVCTSTVTSAAAATRAYYAYVESDGSAAQAASNAVSVAWEGDPWLATIAASSPSAPLLGNVTLTATASRDVGPTQFYLDIRDGNGTLTARCGDGVTCQTTVTSASAAARTFHTAIEMFDGTGVQAVSDPVTVTWANVPGAPTDVTGVAGIGTVDVSWLAPASNGGGAISGYAVTGSPSGTCTTTGALTCRVSGLTGGTPYAFTVIASNGAGPGPASAASAPVVPAGLPGAPTAVTAVRGNAAAQVSWSAAAANGSAITAYTVTSSTGGKHCATTGAVICTVTGLTNGQPYTFTVTATNGAGVGPASGASNSVTPAAVPDAPTSVGATAGDGSAVVTWAAAVSGGSAVTGYTVAATPGVHGCTTTGALTCSISGLANGTTYLITVKAANTLGSGPVSSPAVAVTPRVGATYVGLTPSRLLDTRGGAKLSANTPFTFQVTGRAATDPTRNVPANATAVTGVLTVTGSSAAGFVSLTPEPVPSPTTSTINFPRGDSRSSGVTVPVGTGGKLSITYGAVAGAKTDAIFDVTGYFVPGTSGATYISLTPNRIVDSRTSARIGITTGALTAGTAATFTAVNRTPGVLATNVPANAVAVTGNLTVSGQTAAGFLSLGPDALNVPVTASLYFPWNDIRATGLTVKLGAGGALGITFTSTTAGAKADVIFDVTGYFIAGTTGATYIAVTPNRLLDSRPTASGHTNTGFAGVLRPYTARAFLVCGRFPSDSTLNIPVGAVAVTGTLTVTGQAAAGFLSLTDVAINRPGTSNLNFPTADTRATGVTVRLGSDGRLWVTYGAATSSTNAIFDVTGYFVN